MISGGFTNELAEIGQNVRGSWVIYSLDTEEIREAKIGLCYAHFDLDLALKIRLKYGLGPSWSVKLSEPIPRRFVRRPKSWRDVRTSSVSRNHSQ